MAKLPVGSDGVASRFNMCHCLAKLKKFGGALPPLFLKSVWGSVLHAEHGCPVAITPIKGRIIEGA